MDLVTHILGGLCMAELGFTRRLGPTRARLLGVAAASLPELDALSLLWGHESYLFRHRGLTHGIPLALALAVLSAILALKIRPATRPREATWGAALALAALAIGGHLALDVASDWGPALLHPFSAARMELDWLVVVDPVLYVLFSFAFWGRWVVGQAPRAARWALVSVGIYVGLVGAASGVARKRAAAWARQEGVDVEQVAAFPQAPGGLFWSTVAFNEEEALWRPVDILGASYQGTRLPRGLEEPLVQEFLATEIGKQWWAFSRIPVAASLELPTGGYEVWVRDLSFINRFHPREGLIPGDLQARFSPGGLLADHLWFLDGPPPNPPSPLPGIPGVTQGLANRSAGVPDAGPLGGT